MLVFFTFDDHTDEETPDEVWHNSKIMIDALTYPDKPRPKGEWVGGEIGRQYEPFRVLTEIFSLPIDWTASLTSLLTTYRHEQILAAPTEGQL